jgi:hypothetical protein
MKGVKVRLQSVHHSRRHRDIGFFIDTVYNIERLHSALLRVGSFGEASPLVTKIPLHARSGCEIMTQTLGEAFACGALLAYLLYS